ncbi:type VI secretion system tip protein VgrG, partial [Pseudomonas sp. Dout3]|nr:type VI secretion system tip protein VgrG [Pseudomonas sp. Dout3]MEB0099618.1 type VI secretion system tip protein VgrG [Pseudomonas sp. DC1.2]
GQHIVINASGIFSSVAIVQGGAPVVGVVAAPALSAEQAALAALQVPVLPLPQRLALMDKKPICAVCEAARQQGGPAHV